jgi:DNA-binding NarL/FixJ family response regulator
MMSEQTISIMIADDHPLLRSGIAAVLTSNPRFAVVAEADDGRAAVELFRQFRPNVTLMDLQMPGMDGIEATRAIRQIDPQALIIILTTFDGDAQVKRCLQAGASGYILKSLACTDLIDYVNSIRSGLRVLPPSVDGNVVKSFQIDALSEREVEVLRLVAGGNSNMRVASKLGLREDTIKAHLKAIFLKLDARDRTHAVMIALRRGYWEANSA